MLLLFFCYWCSRFPSSVISLLLENCPLIILWVDHWNQLIFLLYKNTSLFDLHSSMIFSPDIKFWVESLFFQHLKILLYFLGPLYFLVRNWMLFNSLLCRIQSKITQLTKEQENRTNSQVKMQPTDLNPQITQMLESLDFKGVIIIFGQEGKLNTFEMNER